ncbi:tetratricopeptide repeat protein [Aquincola sp. S2]|uniref:Tetratricopeptide repeat protein n=1 Tax=Pseudaquabacterium terrae TaxID=2732868 RepID=A0ABX2EFA7_9BURK|nr:tetratricopeptide repeat protein [Aquabacterium terrae]NRF67320.1 tetratricopeptide repeat protein [Aquabacterium terrae]
MPLAHRWLKLQAIGLLVLGRSAAAERVFDRMLLRWPQDAYALASRAHARALRGAVDEALHDAAALVAAHPGASAAHWFNYAFLLEQRGRLADAEEAFRRAVELDPKLDRAWYGLGVTLIRLRRYEDAEAALVRNTELQPMSPYGWYHLARVYIDRHEPDAARRVIRHLKGFEPQVAAQLERETGLAS